MSMLMLVAVTAAAAQPSPPARCYPEAQFAGTAEHGTSRRLDQLPPANLYLTVFRTVDGCTKPVVVRYEVGAKRSSR